MAVLDKIEHQLRDVTHLIFELDEIVGQKISTGWMKCEFVQSGVQFKQEDMDASYKSVEDRSDSMKGGAGKVMCTTSLGLVCSISDSSVQLLKPMVILDSALCYRD